VGFGKTFVFWDGLDASPLLRGEGSSAQWIRHGEEHLWGRARGSAAATVSRSALRLWVQTDAARTAGVQQRSIPQDLFYHELSKYRFLLAPLGDGIWTPKVTEALMVLTIPIVQRGPYPLFDDYVRMGFPIVVIDEWHEVTQAALEAWWRRLSPRLRSFRDNCLTTEAYWKIAVGELTSCA